MTEDIDLAGIHVWPDTFEARSMLTAEDVAKIRAEREALLGDPDVQRYRAWVKRGLENGSMWGTRG